MTARYDHGALAGTLRQALKKKGLTYATLAERLGMSESGLKKTMTADDVSLARLAAICEAAELDLMALLEAAWKAPPTVFHHTEEQIAFFREHPAHYRFLIALLQCNLDLERLAREYDLDSPSIVRYLGALEELGLVEAGPEGRVRSVIPPPYRTAGPQDPELHDGPAFLDLALRRRPEGRRIMMAGWRMTAEHYEELKVAVRDVILEHGMRAHQDELTRPDEELVTIHILAAMAPCRHSDYVEIPRLPRSAE